MPRTQEELDAARRDDLRRIVEAEAALMLLLRRGTKSVDQDLNASARSRQISDRAEIAATLGWRFAVESSFAATAEQTEAATGAVPEFGVDEVLGDIGELSAATIAQGAHSIASASLASEIDGQKDGTASKIATVAAVLAATAFNRTREATVLRLPKRRREELWVRRDTAGDRRVCPVCDKMDGDIAPASVGLSPKAPLHPSCRCSDTLISRAEAEIQPVRQPRTEAVAEPPRAKPLKLGDGTRSASKPRAERPKAKPAATKSPAKKPATGRKEKLAREIKARRAADAAQDRKIAAAHERHKREQLALARHGRRQAQREFVAAQRAHKAAQRALKQAARATP